MRSSHPRRASTWSTTWFSTFWRQRISTAVAATSAAIADRALRAAQASAFEGPRPRKPHSRFLRHYYYNPNHGRQHTRYRGRPKGSGSDSGCPDERRTSCNSGGRPFGRWSNSSGGMSSHHRPQRRGVYFPRAGVRVRKRKKLECAFPFPSTGLRFLRLLALL